VPVPGASAVLAALVASGRPSDAFMFAGFVPVKPGQRAKRLAELKAVPATLIFFESPKRIAASRAAMVDAFGGARPAAVVRELTKVYESVRRGTLAELAAAHDAEAPPRGEIVVVVGPPSVEETSAEDADKVLMSLMETRSVSAAAAEAAALTGLPRRQLYARALQLKGDRA
jgi:16S rRNA (cytidine1402-2'-O)-methyltransferase